MSAGVEPVEIIDPWLFSLFKTDPVLTPIIGGRVSNGAALGPTATPFLVWEMNSSIDKVTTGGAVLWNESLFLIKAVGQGGSYSQVLPIAKRIQELVGNATNVQTPKGVVSCRRDRVVRYAELDDNVQYRHLGGVYRLTAHT